MALVTEMSRHANVTTVGTTLSLPLSPVSNSSQSQNNETTLDPEPFQNLADRIKGRSRKAAMNTQIAYTTSMARPTPQQPSFPSPSKKVRRISKRPEANEVSEIPAPSMAESRQASSSSPSKTARRNLKRLDLDEIGERERPTRSMAKPQLSSSSPSKTARKNLKRSSQDEVSERPAQVRKVVQDEEMKDADIREAARRHEALQNVEMADANITETKAPILPNMTNVAPTLSAKTSATSTLTAKTSAASTLTATSTAAPTHPTRTTTATPQKLRPLNDTAANIDFANKVITALRSRHKSRAKCFGHRQNEAILDLLRNAKPATREEMLFLTGAEAAQFLAPGAFHNGPILTEGQQPMPLQRIEDFLGEFYDDDSKVFVQDPSVTFSGNANFVREVTIGAVKKRLLLGKSKGRPWNCLELATHVEDGLRPAFLAGEDSRLLTKVKLEHSGAGETAGRRRYPQGYKEVEKWALLAEAGALTEPHQDSHGYSTYITVNQGAIGFGWLSYPTDSERAAWNKDQDVPGDRFRYVVMKPGQTVFFPAGTVHFVFRLPRGAGGGHTLAFGGHVLRCSNILHWIKTLIEERASPNVTNEDLTSSAPGYLNQVEKFVRQAREDGTVGKWGGAEAVEEFLRLKEVFMAS
jgi:hypothetical protein